MTGKDKELMLCKRMPTHESIAKRLYETIGEGLHDYAYSICGGVKIHQGRMSIERLQNGLVLCQDMGSLIKFTIQHRPIQKHHYNAKSYSNHNNRS